MVGGKRQGTLVCSGTQVPRNSGTQELIFKIILAKKKKDIIYRCLVPDEKLYLKIETLKIDSVKSFIVFRRVAIFY